MQEATLGDVKQRKLMAQKGGVKMSTVEWKGDEGGEVEVVELDGEIYYCDNTSEANELLTEVQQKHRWVVK